MSKTQQQIKAEIVRLQKELKKAQENEKYNMSTIKVLVKAYEKWLRKDPTRIELERVGALWMVVEK